MNALKRLARQCAELLYPRRCPFCDEVTGPSGACAACAKTMAPLMRPPGKPLPREGREFGHLDDVWTLCVYTDDARAAILRMKFHDRPDLALSFAGLLTNVLRAAKAAEPDAVCYVPSSRRETRRRGYNVPRLLAKELGSALDVPVLDCLVKTRETPRQATLSGAERRRNLRSAFSVKPDRAADVRGKALLLVDDVVTTGSTLNECAHALRKAGAASCAAIVIAAAREEKEPPAGSQ